jgi:hypothetical protein
MWMVAGAVGIAVAAVTVAVLAVVARLLPPGRGRDLAGFIPNCLVLLDEYGPIASPTMIGAA